MMPEIYKKYKEVDIITRGNATRWNLVRVDDQTGEQTSQKVTAGEAIANHAPAISTNGTWSNQPNSTPMRRNMKAPQYFANPAEILLEFTDGVILPSKEELLSAFSKFGILIESASDILEDLRGARVVFGKSAEAEAAYTKRETPGIFGQFGPPFATLERLNYLPPFTPSIPPFMPSIPPPALKPPLNDAEMKKNLQNMISSLAAATSAGARPPLLISDMERLLLQIDNKEAGPSSSASAP
jgi:ataxia telangiectasia mutated family protein